MKVQSSVRFYKKSAYADYMIDINEKNIDRPFLIGENAVHLMCLSTIRPTVYIDRGFIKMKMKFSLSLLKEGIHYDEYKIVSEVV